MGNDMDILNLDAEEAEEYGLREYGVPNGSLVGTKHWKTLMSNLKLNLENARANYSIDCMYAGVNVDGTPMNVKYSPLRCLDLCDVDFEPTKKELEEYRLQTLARRQRADKAGLIVDDIEKACDYIGRKSDNGYTKPIVQRLTKKQYIGEQKIDDILSNKKEMKSDIVVKTTPVTFSLNDDFTKTIIDEYKNGEKDTGHGGLK